MLAMIDKDKRINLNTSLPPEFADLLEDKFLVVARSLRKKGVKFARMNFYSYLLNLGLNAFNEMEFKDYVDKGANLIEKPKTVKALTPQAESIAQPGN